MRVTCPNCGTNKELWSKGLYKRVRSVIDVTDMYYLAAEYMDWRSCKETKDKTVRMEMSFMVIPCSRVGTHVCGQSCVLVSPNQSCVSSGHNRGTSETNDLEFLLETIQDLGHIMQHDDKTI